MPRINEGLPNDQEREPQEELIVPEVNELRPPRTVLEETRVSPERMRFEMEFGNLKIAIADFNEKKHQYLVGKKELAEYLHFLEKSESTFERGIKNKQYREEAMKCLNDLLIFTIYEEEVYPDDSRAEMEQLESKQGDQKFRDFHDHVYKVEKKVAEKALTIIESLQPTIEKSRKQIPSGFDDELMLDLYQAIARTDYKQTKGADFLSNHMAEIEKGFDGDKWRYPYLEYIRSIIYWGSRHDRKEASRMIAGVLLTCDDQKKFETLLSFLLESEFTMDDATEIIHAKLLEVGLPPFEVLSDWHNSTDTMKWDKFNDAMIVNLRRIQEIERVNKGAAKFLHENFGISDFARYPKEILLDMVENYANREKPYGVIIFPRNDHNGAFYHSTETFKDLHKQLKGEFLLRVAECENKMDIARTLIGLNNQYNPEGESGHKISLLVLGGHGEKDSIQFGGRDAKHSLRTQDLMGKGVQKTSKFFTENPTIILVSCSTGTEKGIGQELSQKLGAKVIAPKVPTNLSRIVAQRNKQEKFEFSAEFLEKDSASLYQAGNLKTQE